MGNSTVSLFSLVLSFHLATIIIITITTNGACERKTQVLTDDNARPFLLPPYWPGPPLPVTPPECQSNSSDLPRRRTTD